MSQTIDPSITHIYEAWHATVKARDLAKTAALYADDAILESPLILAVYPENKTGAITGRSEIFAFFEESLRKFPGDLSQWYRSNTFFVNGNQLVWEYPRRTLQGEQVDLVESMEIRNGLIAYHKVYWGWYGFSKLASALRS